ncbi:MAG: YqaA family protein [Thermodesulfobacteriota bacterium]
MWELTGYLGLFGSAFGAATLLPLQSEAVLAGLLFAGRHPVWILLLVATCGNVLGSTVNWWMGRSLDAFREKPWFPVKEQALEKARRSYHRHGRWSLLLSWAPVIGDPLTVVAGLMRESLWSFLLLVTLAKAGRYLVLAMLVLGWVE